MNVCTFIGRAGRDAELRYTSSGTAVANVNIAVDRFKKDAEPLWIRVTVWGKLAETISKFITKGKLIGVSGRLDLETYESRDGEEKMSLTLNANDVTLGGGGRDSSEPEAAETQTPLTNDEDISF